MSEKVTLPKEVAEAIEDVCQFDYSNAEIIATIVNDYGQVAYGTEFPVLIKYSREDDGNLDRLMAALVNGYEVEKTPEENLREYYGRFREGNYPDQYYRAAIRSTLEILGVKVEGINA